MIPLASPAFLPYTPQKKGIYMEALDRITLNPEILGGKPCIRGMRVTVGTVIEGFSVFEQEGKVLGSHVLCASHYRDCRKLHSILVDVHSRNALGPDLLRYS